MLETMKARISILNLLADIQYDGQLSATAYILLSIILLIIIGGLGWCFYRAIIASNAPVEEQRHDEVGDSEEAVAAGENN